MACNPHFDQPVTEKQIASSNVRKVLEIAPTLPVKK
jgi:hypothetical protein